MKVGTAMEKAVAVEIIIYRRHVLGEEWLLHTHQQCGGDGYTAKSVQLAKYLSAGTEPISRMMY